MTIQIPRSGLKRLLASVLFSLASLPGVVAAADEAPLAPCPAKPNCVSSRASDAAQQVAPLTYKGDPAAAQSRLLEVLGVLPRVKVRRNEPGLIEAEFSSRLFGFVDDVTFVFEPAGSIQLRSASRVGYYDFGANRDRVDLLRARFDAAGDPAPR